MHHRALRRRSTARSPVADHPQGATWLDDLRAARVVWKRELIRFRRNRIRIVTSLAQPILFLFVLGTGLGTVIKTSGHFDFRTFMFPGVIAMTILFTAIFSAVSIVWDREFGFLREMLVAPVRRGAIMVGKCGGAIVATMQGASSCWSLAGPARCTSLPVSPPSSSWASWSSRPSC